MPATILDVDAGQGSNDHGNIGAALNSRNMGFDPGRLRPYMENGVPCVTINTGRMIRDDKAPGHTRPERKQFSIEALRRKGIYVPTENATTLRKEDYIMIDRTLVMAARYRQRAAADLKALSTYGGFNGMSKETLEYEVMSDPGEAIIDMDGLTQGRTDHPLFGLSSLPLTITHVDLTYSQRRIDVMSSSGLPFTSQAMEWAGTRIGESIEKQTIGTDTDIEFGTISGGPTGHRAASKVYGYTTHPARITKTNLTTPTGSNPDATVADVLAMRQTMYNNKFFGPFMIYHSTDWDTYLDNDYARLGGNNATMTLRDRLKKIEDVVDVRRLDFLFSSGNPYTLIMAQWLPTTQQMVVGMGLTAVQWPSKGGMQQNWKILCIEVPRFQYDINGILAVQHATTS
jgi:hypothetical protein